MKVSTVGVLAGLGMLLSSVTVWSVTPAGGALPRVAGPQPAVEAPADEPGLATFQAGGAVMMEGRLGHSELRPGSRETWALVTVRGAEGAAAVPPPLNLAIVIDRSGSMRGRRLENALSAARAMVGRLRDGDVVTLVAYENVAETLVPSTTVDFDSRRRVLSAIDRIQARGDTCISCGLDAALGELRARRGMVDRVLLLSDGEPTAGVRDLEGFRRLGAEARRQGVAISSVGVDVEYDERVMSVLARESNGRHHFVEREESLADVFAREMESLASTVGDSAELGVTPAPGVQVLEVKDRSFRRDGDRVVVPLGTVSVGETKTVLLRLRVAAEDVGRRDVGRFELTYTEPGSSRTGSCEGALALRVVDGHDAPLDGLVAGRVERAETASVLEEANRLFAQGRREEARARLQRRATSLSSAAPVAAAPLERRAEVERDFARQKAALDDADRGFAAEPPPPGSAPNAVPPAATRKGRAQVRSNMAQADDFAF